MLDETSPAATAADFGAEAWLRRPGCCVHYWLRGDDPSKRLVVFLHGAGLDHRMWAGQVEAFARRYRVLTVDLRGHGRSRPAERHSFEAMVEDCLALLDVAGEAPAVVVGLSMGGNLAQEVAFRRPGRVAAMICLDCACNTLVPWTDRLLAPLYRAMMGPMMALIPTRSLLDRIAERSARRPEVRAYLRDASARLSRAELARVMASLLGALHHEPGYRVTIPELLMHGADDRLGNIRRVMPLWRRRDPDSELVVIPDASHCASMDNPDFFNRTALEWLQRRFL